MKSCSAIRSAPQIHTQTHAQIHTRTDTHTQTRARATTMAGVRGLQLSNPGVLQTVALLGSLEIFDQTDMATLRKKSALLTGASSCFCRATLTFNSYFLAHPLACSHACSWLNHLPLLFAFPFSFPSLLSPLSSFAVTGYLEALLTTFFSKEKE